jgi:hypothetical protein
MTLKHITCLAAAALTALAPALRAREGSPQMHCRDEVFG